MPGLTVDSWLTFCAVDGFIKASPACRRAVLQSVEALRAAGHECVEISVPDRKRKVSPIISKTSLTPHSFATDAIVPRCRWGGRVQKLGR